MSIRYTLEKNPPCTDNKQQTFYPKVVTYGTATMEDFENYSHDVSSASRGDVKVVMSNLIDFIKLKIKEGYSIHLEGIGSFSATLQSQPIEKEDKVRAQSIKLKTINFKCSSQLRNELRETTHFVKQTKDNSIIYTKAQRIENMHIYLNKHEKISARIYSRINNCSHYLATKDLKTLVEENIMERKGYKSSTHYKRV